MHAHYWMHFVSNHIFFISINFDILTIARRCAARERVHWPLSSKLLYTHTDRTIILTDIISRVVVAAIRPYINTYILYEFSAHQFKYTQVNSLISKIPSYCIFTAAFLAARCTFARGVAHAFNAHSIIHYFTMYKIRDTMMMMMRKGACGASAQTKYNFVCATIHSLCAYQCRIMIKFKLVSVW